MSASLIIRNTIVRVARTATLMLSTRRAPDVGLDSESTGDDIDLRHKTELCM